MLHTAHDQAVTGRGLVPRMHAVFELRYGDDDMHRGPVAVLFEAQTWVRTSPGAGAVRKRMVLIDQFCKYKAFTANLADDGASDSSACILRTEA